MKKHIQIFTFFLALLASAAVSAQGAGKVHYSDISFNAQNLDEWTVKQIPADATGQYVLATSKVDRSQFVLEMRSGKIARAGVKTAGGIFKTLEPASTPCSTINCTSFQISHCFILSNGTCVCVCGAWITNDPNN